MAGRAAFRPLGELMGNDCPHARLPAAWIADRSLLTHRKWSPASSAALHVARQAAADAGWGRGELQEAALVVGTSRGNAAGWLEPWPGRRPFRVMAASNTIHSEPATAVSIELGITGPNHVLASGCAAGLDAAGIALMMLQAGLATRALVVAVDLPLVTPLLDSYTSSGLLAENFNPDPYSPSSNGFIPGEGAAAMALELADDIAGGGPRVAWFGCNSDACDPVGMAQAGGMTPKLLQKAIERFGIPSAVCPHATGTAVQAKADPAALAMVLPPGGTTLHLLKPFTGHTIGASGLLESVILAGFLQRRELPPNLPHLHAPPGFTLPHEVTPATSPVFKLSHGMGGHNALLVLTHS
jgi:3-oxoacyl-[acyl-carrier-protein] synthase II